MAGHQVLVLRIGVRIPAPQLPAHAALMPGVDDERLASRRWRPDRPDPRRRPGHAHALAHAEGAARAVRAADGAVAGARGAARPAPGGSSSSTPPRARWQGVLPDGVELAVQAQPDGTGGAVAAAIAHLRRRRAGSRDGGRRRCSCSAATCRCVSAEAIRGAARRARRAAARRRRWSRRVLDDPSGYGRVVRDASGGRASAWWRPRASGDATRGELRDPRGQHGHLRLRGGGAARRAAAPERRQRAGRAVPAAGARRCCAPTAQRSRRTCSRTAALMLGVNDRVALAQVRKLAQQAIHERHMRAGVDDRRPATRP